MNGEQLLYYLGALDEELVQQHCGLPQRKSAGRWKKMLAAAASVCLILTTAVGALVKLGYFSAGCGSWPGTIVNGTYYYTVPHSGVWAYAPGGKSEKLVSSLFMDGWLVNENGLYLHNGRSLYRKDLQTGKTEKLFTAPLFQSSHIGFSLMENGDVVVTVYDKHRKRKQQLLLDGITGEVLRQVSAWVSYGEIYDLYEYTWFTVGESTYQMVPTTDLNGEDSYDLQCNGRSVLPEGYFVVFRPVRDDMNGNLLVDLYTGRKDDHWKTKVCILIRKDGSIVPIRESRSYYETATPDGWYLFYIETETDAVGNELLTAQIGCYEVDTGEAWLLPMDADTHQYDLTGDGEYLYTSAPWADEQACWRIDYDEAGRPAALTLVDADIRNAR